MYFLRVFLLSLFPITAFACDAPVCLVAPDGVVLTRVITFDDLRSSGGPGHPVDEVLVLDGASIGEHFAGQTVTGLGAHDDVSGTAFAPLTLMPGPAGQNFSVVHFSGQTVINGYGMSGFPKRDAQGEGALAVLFESDQSAFGFDLRGGEAGAARVDFLRRDGSHISAIVVEPTGEFSIAFLRSDGEADIAGFIVTNTDPQGLAIDTLRFGKPPDLS